MNAGQFDRWVTFRRRSFVNVRDRGGWQDHASCWGNYRRLSGKESLEAGRQVNVEEGTLRVRWPGAGGDIANGDRVLIDGRERNIASVGTPERRGGFVEMTVTTDVKS